MPSPISSDSYLKRLYNLYNRKYFGNRLPPDTIVRWAPKRKMKEGKFTLWGAVDYIDTGHERVFVIELNNVIRRNKWNSVRDGTLLHEMVHMTNWRMNHTKTQKFDKFDAGMLRIAMMGALHGIW